MASTIKYRIEKTLASMNLRNRRCCLNSSCDGVSEIRSRMDVRKCRRIALSPIDRRRFGRCQCIEPFFPTVIAPSHTMYNELLRARDRACKPQAGVGRQARINDCGAVRYSAVHYAYNWLAGIGAGGERMLPTR